MSLFLKQRKKNKVNQWSVVLEPGMRQVVIDCLETKLHLFPSTPVEVTKGKLSIALKSYFDFVAVEAKRAFSNYVYGLPPLPLRINMVIFGITYSCMLWQYVPLPHCLS